MYAKQIVILNAEDCLHIPEAQLYYMVYKMKERMKDENNS